MYGLRVAFVSLLLLISTRILCAAQPGPVVCFGDSITAGYGLEPTQAWPAALGRLLAARGEKTQVLNRGTSGATTKDAVATLPQILALHPAVVVVEFGGNDGLRGLPLEQSRQNLDQVLTALDKAHVRVILAGITLPPNYGPQYIRQFEQIYRDLAQRHHATLIPMLYRDLIHAPGSIQPDGIHPTASGSERIARTVLEKFSR